MWHFTQASHKLYVRNHVDKFYARSARIHFVSPTTSPTLVSAPSLPDHIRHTERRTPAYLMVVTVRMIRVSRGVNRKVLTGEA